MIAALSTGEEALMYCWLVRLHVSPDCNTFYAGGWKDVL